MAEKVTATVNGVDYTFSVDGNPSRSHSFEEGRRCVICGFSYRKSQTKKIDGKDYGIPCKCYEIPIGENKKERT